MHYKEVLHKRLELSRSLTSFDMREYHTEQTYLLEKHIKYLEETPFEDVVLSSDDAFQLDQIKFLYDSCEVV
jgi:hypothetical protein